MFKISDLRVLEVINIADGRRLGPIKDIDIDLEHGRISAIILPGQTRFMGFFGRDEEIVVPWEKVRKIGVDVILVELADLTGVYPDRIPPPSGWKERYW